MSLENIEDRLTELRKSWPGKSVAGDIASRLQDEERQDAPLHKPASRSGRSRLYSAIGVIITAAVMLAVGLWLTFPQSLQAALQQSLQKAKSWHVMKEVFEDSTTVVAEVWFRRDVGFRMEESGQVTLDDGEQSYVWSKQRKAPVLLRPATDGAKMISRIFDLSQMPLDWEKHRDPDLDKKVDGEELQAFVIVRPGTNVNERFVAMVDSSHQPREFVELQQVDEDWLVRSRIKIDYDLPIADAVFKRDFPKDSKIVDVRTILQETYPLKAALATKEAEGLLFAVHDAIPVQEHLWFVVSTVRGTPEYLRKYPPKSRRINPRYSARTVAPQSGSHGSVGSTTQLLIYQIEWQGVDYLWRLVDFGGQPAQSPKVANAIRLPLIANHMHADRRDARGVQLQTRVELDVPVPDRKKCALEDVIADARNELNLAAGVMGDLESPRVAGAVADNTVTFHSLSTLTDSEYAKELRKAHWQLRTGNWTGEDPPEGEELIAFARKKDVEAEPPLPEAVFSNEPLPLPTEVTGSVVNEAGDPISGAKVSLRIRRFSKKKDGEASGPGPWTAVSDQNGQYKIKPTGTIRANRVEVRIDVVADGFADTHETDYEKQLLKGTLPDVRMLDGRRINGQVVNAAGEAVSKCIVRIQSNNEDLTKSWDSGPFAINGDGSFSVSLPEDGKAIAVFYPRDFAARFFNISDDTDQGKITLDNGTRLKGQVRDRHGKGVSGVVVGLRSTEYRLVFAYMALIQTAVRTDDEGYFQLPPLVGEYRLSVGKSVPDYTRQMMIVGANPPDIEPVVIDTTGTDPEQLIILAEESDTSK